MTKAPGVAPGAFVFYASRRLAYRLLKLYLGHRQASDGH